MSLDQDLRATFGREAEQCTVPELDLTQVLERGRAGARRHTRRRAAVVVAAALVVAVGVGVLPLLLHGGRPAIKPSEEPTERTLRVQDLPVGAPPAVPYCQDGDQILGAGTPISSHCLTLFHRGDQTIGTNADGVYWLADGKRGLLDASLPPSWMPAISHDGQYAAWVTDESGSSRLLVFDLASHSSVADLPVPIGEVWVPGIDDLDRVYLVSLGQGEGNKIWSYDIPAAKLTQLRGVPAFVGGGVTYVTSDGFAMDHGTFFGNDESTSHSQEGTVTPDGRFVSRGSVPIGWSAWSPDRARVVQETADGFWVQRASDLGSHVALDLPDVGRPTGWAVWESNDAVLVSFGPTLERGPALNDDQNEPPLSDSLWVLRCSATTGDCEVALPPGQAGPGMRGALYR